ncbi:MAG: sulfatase [Planctomycetota bacterium]
MSKPNIVFVFADQMRAQATGYAGDPNVKTPHLDALAAESVNFTTAVSNCPICTPYRACLMTGQYPLTHGLFMNDLCLGDTGQSLGQVLKRAGYATAWIGKWHLDGHGRTAYIPPERRQGFDHWQVLECTHAYNRSQYYDGDDPTPRFWEGYDTYAQTDAALDTIAGRDTARPFALFLSFGTPHDPYPTAPEDLKALYPPDSIELRPNVRPHREAQAREQLQGYYAHITAIDQSVGRLDKALRDAGLRDDTIFVVTSDHGDMIESQWDLAGRQRGARKQQPYDESILVPQLLRYPARFGDDPREVTAPFATPDLMPTLLSLAGVATPDTAEGIDVADHLDGGPAPDRTGVLIANYHPFADWRTERGGRAYRGVRTGRYTFVRDRNGPWMLFDNHEDPYQLTNLVNKAAAADVQQRLDAELTRILAEQGDTFEPPETLRRRWGYTLDDAEAIPF